jgi:hypothetical protein
MLPVLLALAIIGLLLFVIIVGRPDEFTVSRSAKMVAPPEKIFPHVNELKKWDDWSPWAKLDPNCQITYAGPPVGVDASYSWVGNNKVGAGKLTITESVPCSLVRFRLEFIKPFQATNAAEFKFQSEGGQTLVTWSMVGNNNFMSKIFSVLVDCEKMVGKDFEKGLASIKAIVEAGK